MGNQSSSKSNQLSRSSGSRRSSRSSRSSRRSSVSHHRASISNRKTVVNAACFKDYRVIGNGSFGKVCVARSTLSGDPVAIKIISKARLFRNGKNHSELLWLERATMIHCQLCQVRFTVPLTHAFQDTRDLYLVMPLYVGGDLDYRMAPSRWTDQKSKLEALRFYSAEIILGLLGMHNIGLCHRDIKPSNIFVGGDGHIRIGDFGLVKEMTSDLFGNLTQSSQYWGHAGSYGYRAPEVLGGLPANWSADVWSLGLTIYKMNCGYLPWEHESDFDQPLPIDQGDDQDLVDLLSLMLNLNPVDRPTLKDIMRHPFFRNINWAEMHQVPPPVMSSIDSDCLTRLVEAPAFSPFSTKVNGKSEEAPDAHLRIVEPKFQALFKGFEYKATIDNQPHDIPATWAGVGQSVFTGEAKEKGDSKMSRMRRSVSRKSTQKNTVGLGSTDVSQADITPDKTKTKKQQLRIKIDLNLRRSGWASSRATKHNANCTTATPTNSSNGTPTHRTRHSKQHLCWVQVGARDAGGPDQ